MTNIYRPNGTYGPVLTESEFIIDLVIRQYNKQFYLKQKIADFELTSTRPRINYKYGYEIVTKRKDDFLKFRVYLNPGKIDVIHPFLNEVKQGYSPPMTQEDEYLVALGTIDYWYTQEGVYTFRPVNNEEMLKEYIALEDGTAILLENGEVLEL